MSTVIKAAAGAGLTLALAAGAWILWPQKVSVKIADNRCVGCNVILISADSVRADRMSLYGYNRDTTPHIREWARKAMVFENFFATAYLTPISEASIHTGLYPEVNGMISFRHEISSEVKTLAGYFKDAGYRTIASGSSPEFFAYESIEKSFARDFEIFQFPNSRLDFNRTPNWRAIRNAMTTKDRPFFLWIALGDAHSPFGEGARNLYADEKYDGPFADLKFFTNMQFYYDGWFYNPLDPDKHFEVLVFGGKNRKMHFPNEESIRPRKWPVKATPADMKYINDMYDNGVAEVDQEFAKVLRMLRNLKIEDRTVIVFQSEHGEDLGEHKYVAHYDIFDTHVHVPLIFASPALKQPGRSAILVSGVDVAPTILEHVGIKTEAANFDGANIFTPAGEPGPGREEVFLTRTPLWESIIKAKGQNAIFDRFRALDDQVGFKDHGIRTRSAKLIHRTSRLVEEQFSCWTFVSGKKLPREEFEYYDLIQDPGELRPLPPPATAAVMKEKLAAWKADVARRARKTPVSEMVQDYR